jgi:hypothetical protein
MPIRWSALKVSGAADKIEELIKQAAEPLEQIRIVAREARKLPNLPQYMDSEFGRIVGEVDRAIGGSQWEPTGRLRAGIKGIWKNLPDGAVKAESDAAKHGATQSLI